MDAWELLDKSKAQLRMARVAAVLAASLTLATVVVVLGVLFWRQPLAPQPVKAVEVVLPETAPIAVAQSFADAPQPIHVEKTLTTLPTSNKSDGYAELIGEAPSLSYAAVKRGPQLVRFTAGEDVSETSVGVAQFVSTDVPGAAGEWLVRPWWQLGWIPEAVDCGEPGTSAIAGHVSWYAQPGPLSELASLVEGDVIECQSRGGEWHQYIVTQRWRTDYNDTNSYLLPPQDGEADSILVLYTCTREITGISVIRAESLEG